MRVTSSRHFMDECARETATHSFKRWSDPTTGCRIMEFYIPMISRRGTAVRVAICGSKGSHSKSLSLIRGIVL
jgi:hypothetical protein